MKKILICLLICVMSITCIFVFNNKVSASEEKVYINSGDSFLVSNHKYFVCDIIDTLNISFTSGYCSFRVYYHPVEEKILIDDHSCYFEEVESVQCHNILTDYTDKLVIEFLTSVDYYQVSIDCDLSGAFVTNTLDLFVGDVTDDYDRYYLYLLNNYNVSNDDCLSYGLTLYEDFKTYPTDLKESSLNGLLDFLIIVKPSLDTSDYDNGYITGYDKGKNDGYNNGYNIGYDDGVKVGENVNANFGDMILSILDAPRQAISNILNFEFLGINLASLVFFLISSALVFAIVKFFI